MWPSGVGVIRVKSLQADEKPRDAAPNRCLSVRDGVDVEFRGLEKGKWRIIFGGLENPVNDANVEMGMLIE